MNDNSIPFSAEVIYAITPFPKYLGGILLNEAQRQLHLHLST